MEERGVGRARRCAWRRRSRRAAGRRRRPCRRSVPTTGNWAGNPAAAQASRSIDGQVPGPRRQLDVDVGRRAGRARPARRRWPAGCRPACRRGTPCPSGVSVSMTSRRPPTAPIGRPPPITLPNVVRSGVTSYFAWAPPVSRRNPVITSSKTSSAPTRSHSARSPSRNPGRGRDDAHVGGDRLDDHRGHVVVELGHHVVRHDHRLGDRTGRHAGRARAARAWRRRCRRRRAGRRWRRGSCRGRSRGGRARCSRGPGAPRCSSPRCPSSSAAPARSSARASAIASASFISRGVGAPYDVPSRRRGEQRRGDRRVGVAEDDRAVALHEVDVAACPRRPTRTGPRRGRRRRAGRRPPGRPGSTS